MSRLPKRAIAIAMGALVLSTVAIQASDVARNIGGGMMGAAIESQSVCGAGAVPINLASGSLCIDQFEASPADNCPLVEANNPQATSQNLSAANCTSISAPEKTPWTFVSHTQAAQLCARSGKRLPTPEEWYDVALALADQSSCVVEGSSPVKTGSVDCVTGAGIADLVGNVWEWVDGQVTNGMYGDRALPERGYVSSVDADGIVLSTDRSPSADFGNDYAITSDRDTFGIIRGGHFGSGDDAGLHAQNLAVPFTLSTAGVGFRCVRSL
jgi:formylglycine-generating enzyme required for sulfatase activity